MKFLILIISFLISTLKITSAQTFQADSVYHNSKDTVCMKYFFVPGDTVYYHVNGLDSIIIGFGQPLLKNRLERIRYVCESVDSQSNFNMSVELVHYLAKEKFKDKENTITDHPWVGRKMYFTLDSTGKRYNYRTDDSSLGGMSPGGAFKPMLFYNIGNAVKSVDETWITDDTTALAENGYPFPVIRYTLLHKMYPIIDTLGERCQFIESILTGQGSVQVISQDANITVTSILSGSSKLYISEKDHIPVHLFSTIEQKLNILTPGAGEQTGKHYIRTNYFLERFIPGPGRKTEKEAD